MKLFSALLEVLYPHLIGPPLDLSIDGNSVTKAPAVVENSFPLGLAPRSKVSWSGKSWGFVIDEFVKLCMALS